MCFSQFAQYAPRPVYQYDAPERPESAPPTKADLDENLYGPKPLPPQWQKPVVNAHGRDHVHIHEAHLSEAQLQNGNGAAAAQVAAAPAPAAAVHVTGVQNNDTASVTSVTTQTVEAVVVELSNGTRLLICPL
jgi:hypothetical protein